MKVAKNPFHSVIPVNCCKLLEQLYLHNQKCAVHTGNGITFFLVKPHSHIGLKLPVNSVTLFNGNGP